MKRLKHNFKKGLALLLSLAMIAGLVPAVSGGADKVQAATGSGNMPSVSAFATKTQLMDAFIPDSDGNATTIGKLAFGKNSSGSAQEWYILGKDTGVSGDNTILFAASPIATGQQFEDDYQNNIRTNSSLWSDCDYNGANITEVYPNHYGASDLRAALQGMLKDSGGNPVTTYFTEAEQGMMNDTTVTTKDTKNSVDYTTTDKLYALMADGSDSSYKTTIKAGSNNQTVLAINSYWNSGSDFWVRCPYDSYGNFAFVASPGYYAYGINVFIERAVQPASNLNLSSVIFASAAKAASSDTIASGTIADGTAMTLRLDGKKKTALTNAGLKYNHGEINYTADSTITLVVQGRGSVNGEVKDWYYSVTGDNSNKKISADDIKMSVGLSDAPNLNDCKIWVEFTDTDGLTYAVMGEGSKPSVTAFATQNELMYAFIPDSDGNATTIGKLVFGKNSSGSAQEWYILGKDTGVSGDNTILFAASPIATGQQFENDCDNNKTNSSLWSDCDYNGASITEVYPNHYGASDLRVALQGMLKDSGGNPVTTYFTEAEQGMMNDTTVTTKDTKNSVDYTTTDKLYALAADGYGSSYKTIKAGSNNQTVLAMNSYWNSGNNWLWLRCPTVKFGNSVLIADPGRYVTYGSGNNVFAVQPASNLNLSSVIFASAAKAASSDTIASGTIADGTAMTLRLDGKDKAIGTVIYDAANGNIVAQKDANAEGTVSLVVQGRGSVNGAEKDWYYSVPVGRTIVVSASRIRGKISLSEAPDLSECDIWLETTIDNSDNSDKMTYAKMAEQKTINVVNSVKVTGMKPVGGTAFNGTASCTDTGISTTKPAITYTTTGADGDVTATGNADWNTTYKATVNLATVIIDNEVCVFADSVSVTIDNETQIDSIRPNMDSTLTITREFTTDKRKIGSVTAPTVPADNTFTTYYGFDGYSAILSDGKNNELGTQATVTFTDSVTPNTEAMDVVWAVENASNADYDNTPGAENTFRWTIPKDNLTNYNAADCAGYDSTKGTITGTVKIKNKAATPVTITGTDSSVAYTGETIDVSSYFNIDTNAGTAKFSIVTGDDGGTGAGTLDGKNLMVTQTGTFKIKVSTEANGIYAAGEKTVTLTVSNGTIEYEAADYSGTYDGQPHSISVNVSNPSGTAITYSTDGNKTYGSDNPSFTDAGTYTVYYRITKDNYDTIEASKTVTINKKSVTITAENQDIVFGNDIDRSKYIVSEGELVEDDSIEGITLQPSTATLTENGTISISGVKIKNTAGKDVTGNYDITTVNGTLKVATATVTAVAITGVDSPQANATLDTVASCTTTGVESTTPQITWTPDDTKAGYNTVYTAGITLTADTGYEFTDSTTATVSGNTAAGVTKNDDGTLTVTYEFNVTAKDKLTGITAPQAIAVENGTAYDAMNMPATVSIVTEGKTVTSAPVQWDTSTPASGSYDPAVLTEQTVTLNGSVTCPDSIDDNGVELTTTIAITISAAGIVGAPTANPAAGTYTENQSVTLTSSTEGATIYYTTDGSEPALSGGAPSGTTQQYTAPIAVTGTEGQSITTTIKAIAVKNGMRDSSVGTFTYTIEIPVPKYDVTVTSGSGTGQYAQGETVTITADAAPSGQQFKEWEVVSGTITLAGSASAITTFTMPAEAVSVKAVYETVPVTEYTITATAAANGSITPGGAVRVAEGGSQTFTISPSSGYEIDTLKVDGVEVAADTSYTFSEVNENHTIEVTFKQESQTPDVTAPSITTQPGNAAVKAGETATFTIAAGGTDLAYQWQIDRNDGNGWVDIGGATETTYTTSTVDISCSGFKYRCVVSNSAGTVISDTAVLTVTEDASDNGNNNQNDNDNDNNNNNNNSNPDDSALPEDSDKKEAPKTGDDTPGIWLFMLLIISGTGLYFTAKKRRRNPKTSGR